MLKNSSIKVKLLAIVIGSLVLVSAVMLFEAVMSLTNTSEDIIKTSSKSAYKLKEQEVKNYVSLAYKTMESYHERTAKDKIQKEVESYLKEQTDLIFSILEGEYKKNKNVLTSDELQKRLKSIISATRFGKDNAGYFFIYNTQGINIVLPPKPELQGKNLMHIKDSNGVFIIKKVVEIGTSSSKHGFFSYLWPKPGFDKPQTKISYVKMFKPYNWIVGTGAYVEDISAKMKQEALDAIAKMRYGKDGYFWVNDSNHIVKAHGAKPNLVGQDMTNAQDKKGKYYYKEIVNTANASSEGGIVKYFWTIPGRDGEFEKFSYVKRFAPWDFIIGTGVLVVDVEEEIEKMNKATEESIGETIAFFVGIIVAITIVITLIVSFMMKRVIFNPLSSLQDGLLNFFRYVNREQDEIVPLTATSQDEIGKMTTLINENIDKTKHIMEQDNMLIEDVKEIVNRVGEGYLDKKIQSSTNNQSLEELKSLLNSMLENLQNLVGNNINALSDVLEFYANRDFTKKIEEKNSGKIGADIVNMSRMITKILQDNQEDGLSLQARSTDLTSNVKVLSENATSQAASLEETAASIEEITGNIKQTNQKAQEMLKISSQTRESANIGKDLATKTVNSMDEINDTVININEAISVIDQIAFQTNILSLNAAVEAATAGEAGKGFAVVAQEVRNLASRSAEAAKEIKELVENATVKANEGKEISSSMIEGFAQLEEKINVTNNLIDDVTNAAREQSTGMVQISDAVNQLDKFTQENANIADRTNAIAQETNEIANDIVENVNNNNFDGKA